MHIYITPIRDKKLSAKSIFNKQELTHLQTDFFMSVGHDFGLKRGEKSEEKRKHLDTQEFKLKTRQQALQLEVKTLQMETEKISYKNEKIPNIHFEPKILEHKLLGLRQKKETFEEVADRIHNDFVKPLVYKIDLQREEISSLKKENSEQKQIIIELTPFKNIFTENITKNQFDELRKNAREYKEYNHQKTLKEKKEEEERKRAEEIISYKNEKEKKCQEARQKVYEKEKKQIENKLFDLLKPTGWSISKKDGIITIMQAENKEKEMEKSVQKMQIIAKENKNSRGMSR